MDFYIQHKKWPYIVMAIFVLAGMSLLLYLPKEYFDKGESLCLSKRLLDMECLGCGLTRATMYLIHGDWREEIYYNPLALLTTPIMFFYLLIFLKKCYDRIVS